MIVKEGKELVWLDWDITRSKYNCGIAEIGGFEVEDIIEGDAARPEKNALHTLLAELVGVGYGGYFLSDCKGGIADKHIFSLVKQEELTVRVGRQNWYVHLSPYYRNPNSGNQIRHMTLAKMPNIPKKKAAKKAAKKAK